MIRVCKKLLCLALLLLLTLAPSAHAQVYFRLYTQACAALRDKNATLVCERIRSSEKGYLQVIDESGAVLAERQIEQNGNAKMIFFDLCLQMIVLIKKPRIS